VVPMVTSAEVAFLHERGWPVLGDPFDLCWMECSDPGWLKTWHTGSPRWGPVAALCICLCERHALLLEQGSWSGDYSGAPLPPESMATEWPWRYCSEVDGVSLA
jgi:hypothetical protein